MDLKIQLWRRVKCKLIYMILTFFKLISSILYVCLTLHTFSGVQKPDWMNHFIEKLLFFFITSFYHFFIIFVFTTISFPQTTTFFETILKTNQNDYKTLENTHKNKHQIWWKVYYFNKESKKRINKIYKLRKIWS